MNMFKVFKGKKSTQDLKCSKIDVLSTAGTDDPIETQELRMSSPWVPSESSAMEWVFDNQTKGSVAQRPLLSTRLFLRCIGLKRRTKTQYGVSYKMATCFGNVDVVQLLRTGVLYKIVKISRSVCLKQVIFAVGQFYLNKLEKKRGQIKQAYTKFFF